MSAGTNMKSIAYHSTPNESGGHPSEILNPKSSIPAVGRSSVCPSKISNLKSCIPVFRQRFLAPAPVTGPRNIKKTERTHRAYTSFRHNPRPLADLLPRCLADCQDKRTHQTHRETRSPVPSLSRCDLSSFIFCHSSLIFNHLSLIHIIFLLHSDIRSVRMSLYAIGVAKQRHVI